MATDAQLRLTVAIPTYRRPTRLAESAAQVLEHVRSVTADVTMSVRAELLIVDNDASASAASVARELAAADVRYVVEPEPGIVAARNRALDECADRDVVVFIDDDETPRDKWLAALVSTYLASRPAAVAGRVVSVYDRTIVDRWVAAADLFERPVWPTGTEVPLAATGNILFDIAQLREKGVRFDRRLGMSGGEDSLLTRLLVQRGGRIVFCSDSVAEDVVVAERLNRRWLLDRAFDAGSTRVRVEVLLSQSAPRRLAAYAEGIVGGMLRLVSGSSAALWGVALHSTRRRARGLRVVWRGLGMIAAGLGRRTNEYGR